MQQDVGHSLAPQRPGTPLPLLESIHVRNLDPKKAISLATWQSSVRVAMRL